MGEKRGEYSAFANRLSELMSESKVSHRDLAKEANVSASGIPMWTSGRAMPNGVTLQKIAQRFNVSVDYLLGLSDAKDPDISVICDYLGTNEEGLKTIKQLFSSNQLLTGSIAYNNELKKIKVGTMELFGELLGMEEFRDIINLFQALRDESYANMNIASPLDDGISSAICKTFKLNKTTYEVFCKQKFQTNDSNVLQEKEKSDQACNSYAYQIIQNIMLLCKRFDKRNELSDMKNEELLKCAGLSKDDIIAIKQMMGNNGTRDSKIIK